MTSQIESPEELIAKHGYPPEVARELHANFVASQGTIRSLNMRTFSTAQHYFEASKALDHFLTTAQNANVAPGIVLCKSFALELFFKTLVILDKDDVLDVSELTKEERNRYFIHTIPELYDEIPIKYKDRLSEVYSDRMGASTLPHDQFRSELVEKANDIFVEWRYLHEKHKQPAQHLNLLILDNLIIAAQIVTLEIKQAK